jgi:hypothetical protein
MFMAGLLFPCSCDFMPWTVVHCTNANYLLVAGPILSVKPSDQLPRVLLLVSELVVAMYGQKDERGQMGSATSFASASRAQ